MTDQPSAGGALAGGGALAALHAAGAGAGGFGAPQVDRILGAYAEVAPLADGWRERVPLHQLHPLLVHVCLFGTGYRDATLSAARAVLGR